WQGDAAVRAQATSLLAAVQAAYYAEKRDEASSRVADLAKLLDELADAPAAVRTKVPLWRAAIHAKEGRAAAAEQEARLAQSLLPDLTVGDELPPAVSDLVTALRRAAFRPIPVHVNGAPAGALVKVDGA